MKSLFVGLLGLVLMVGSVGCASRTGVTVGPVQVAGDVQAYESWQPLSFEIGLSKVSITGGFTGFSVESKIGPCDKIIGIVHATGDTAKVMAAVPSLNSD